MASDGAVNRPRLKLELIEGGAMAAGLMVALIYAVILNPPPTPQGWVLLVTMGVTALLLTYVLRRYLASQWTLSMGDGDIVISHWWERLRSKPGNRLPLGSLRRFVVRRPYELQVQGTDKSVEVSTFWWRSGEFQQLADLAARAGIEVVEERPKLPEWLHKPPRQRSS